MLRSLALVVLLLAPAGCARDTPGPVTGGDAGRLARQLCEAADVAAGGDVTAARAAFDDLHGGLHTYADDIAETDRQRAAEILRAKEEVESGASEGLAEALRELAGAVDDSAPCA